LVLPGLEPRHENNAVKLLKENYQTEKKSGGYSEAEREIFKRKTN